MNEYVIYNIYSLLLQLFYVKIFIFFDRNNSIYHFVFMKYILIIVFILVCLKVGWTDIIQTTQNRISELEQEIDSTQMKIQKLNEDKKIQKSTIYNLTKKINSLQETLYELNNKKLTNEQELNTSHFLIYQNEINIKENRGLLDKLIENINHLFIKTRYLNYNPLINANISNLQICANCVLSNIDSLHYNDVEQKKIKNEKENNIKILKQEIKYNNKNYENKISQKNSVKQELNLIVSIENEYQERINNLKCGIISLEDFIKQKEAEKFGREYSFKFEQDIIWPVTGNLLRKFGIISTNNSKTSIKSKGIYIQVDSYTPVKCITSGIVAYSGWFENKGNLVIIDHQNGFYSLYGYNKKLVVHKGERVGQGQVIAYSGYCPLLDNDCLYFEMRKSGKVVNPLDYLKDE